MFFASQTVQVNTCIYFCMAHKVLGTNQCKVFFICFAAVGNFPLKMHSIHPIARRQNIRLRTKGKVKTAACNFFWYSLVHNPSNAHTHLIRVHTSLMCPSCRLFPVDGILVEYTEEGTTLLGMLTPVAEVHEGCGGMGTM